MRSRIGRVVVAAALVCGVLAGLVWLLRSGDEAAESRPVAQSAVAVSEVLEIEGVAAGPKSMAVDELSPVEKVGTVVDEAFSVDAVSGTGKRVRLVEAPGFAYPILVVRGVEVDGQTGEERTSSLLEMAADRVIVRFKAGVEEAALRERLSLMDIRLGRRLMAGPVYELLFAKGTLAAVPEGMVRLLEGDLAGDLAYVEPNYIVHAFAEPNDPSYLDGSLWGLRNTGQNGGVADVDIDAAEGWAIRSDAGSVVVAVIDTGINYLHRDLVRNLWVNELEIPGNGLDDDGNGFVDDIYGINAIRMDGDPMDDNGHGTHCSGTIGAAGDDGRGVVGVAWNVKLLGTKFLSESGSGATADAITCIDYAVTMGADVLSNSWGGAGYSQALRDAISMAEEQGVVFVAAAGNSGVNVDESLTYPAAYDLGAVVSVASIDRAGKLSRFSNYGVESVDVAAPGEEILSTWVGSDVAYRTISGTSMATPHVSGIMALLKAEYPEESVGDNIGRLFYGARFFGELEDRVRFGAVANLGGSLGLVDVPRPPVFLARLERSVVLVEGSDLVLAADVESELPVSFQWYYEDEVLEGETGSRLEVKSMSVGLSGVYRLVASSEDGQTRSSSRVTVLASRALLAEAFDAPFLSLFSYGEAEWLTYGFDSEVGETSLRSGVVGDGEMSALFTEVQGPGRVSFFWRVSSEEGWDKGELWVDGERSATFASNADWREHSVRLEEARSYRLEWRYVKDETGSAGQDALFLDGFRFEVEGEGPPVILKHPRGGVLGSEGSYALAVTAAGEGLSYRWTKDGVVVPRAVWASLELVADSEAVGGVYVAIVSNEYGEVRSDEARIQIADVPARIEKQPLDLILDTGGSGSFEVSVTGSLPLELQWYRNGEALVGGTDTRLSIQSAKREDAGEYVLKARNAFTPQALSTVAVRLVVNDVNQAPRVVKQPRSGYLQTGEDLRLSAAVEGSFPMEYQWFKDGAALAGQNGRTLAIGSVLPKDAGDYFLEARNSFGVARSQPAMIRVLGDFSDGLDLAGRKWRVDGAAYFFVQSDTTFDGVDALQSSREDSFLGVPVALETDVVGPTTFSLYWKQKAETFGSSIKIYVDNELAAEMRNEREWHEVKAWIPEGDHVVRIVGSIEAGSTVWLDSARLDSRPVVFGDSETVAVTLGKPLELWVDARGAGELSYQWFRNEVAIEGAVESIYRVSRTSGKDSGYYRMDTKSPLGVTRGPVREVRVLDDLASSISDDSVRLGLSDPNAWKGSILDGGEVVLRSGGWRGLAERELVGFVIGPGALVFDAGMKGGSCCGSLALRVDEKVVARYFDTGEADRAVRLTQRAVWIGKGQHLLSWRYEEGDDAFPRSLEAFVDNIRLTSAPVLSEQPRDVRVIEGQTIQLRVEVLGDGDLSYQWYRDDVAVAGAVSPVLDVFNSRESDAGMYVCHVTNRSGESVRSNGAKVVVVGGVYDALDMDFAKLVLGGDAWEPRAGMARDGGPALVYSAGSARPLNTLIFEVNVPNGERRGLSFWIRTSGMKMGATVQAVENNVKRVSIVEDTNWRRVVLPLLKGGKNRFTLSVMKGAGDAADSLEVLLDGFQLVEEPLFYRQPESSSRYWGDAVSFNAEMTGIQPQSYRWMRNGLGVFGGAKMPQISPLLELDRVSDAKSGRYQLSVKNGKGSLLSKEVRLDLLATEFGSAVGAPGSSVWSEGNVLWEVDDKESAIGAKSLSVRGLSPQEHSDLVFWIRGPGVLSMYWKLESPKSDDRLSLYLGAFPVKGLFSSRGWERFELRVDDKFYQVRVRMSNLDSSVGERGQAWVDSIRFSNDGAIRYEDWAAGAFLDTDVSEEERALGADPDGDGVINFVEYAFAENPILPNRMPSLKRFEEKGATRVVVDFPLEAMADDVAFGLELSRDLKTWYPLRSQFLVSEEEGKYQGTLVYRMQAEERPESAFLRMAVYYLGDSE